MANYVKATNFTAKDSLPSGNAGKIIKGAEIDTEYTAIASAISSKADLNSPSLTGTPTAPTATVGTNTTQLATTAFVQTALSGAFTTGMIMMWSGTIATIPTGWVLCNGSNGTPDLRNRFVVGAGSTYSVAATGGSADAIVVSHTHTGTTDSAGEHNHVVDAVDGGTAGSITGVAGLAGRADGIDFGTTNAGTHSHTFTTASAGSSGTNANLPPYYALAFIMKT